MTVYKGPEKGQSVELNISQQGPKRVLVGLSWEPVPFKNKSHFQTEEEAGVKNIADKVLYYIKDVAGSFSYIQYVQKGEKKKDYESREGGFKHFDLDLYCYVFDKDKNFVVMLGPETENMCDSSTKVYHSGEDFSGMGGMDDEQIYIETNNLPDYYHHFVFVVTSDCKYSLDEVEKPEIRMADSKTNNEFIKVAIEPPVNSNAYAYISSHMYKDGDGWKVKNIHDYADFNNNWEDYLKKYL